MYHACMAKPFEIACPCCQAKLTVDAELQAVVTVEEAEKPREISDIEAAMQRFKGESGRREEAFQKSVAAEKKKASLLDRKFDELLKKAKEGPDDGPPTAKPGFTWD